MGTAAYVFCPKRMKIDLFFPLISVYTAKCNVENDEREKKKNGTKLMKRKRATHINWEKKSENVISIFRCRSPPPRGDVFRLLKLNTSFAYFSIFHISLVRV